MERITTVDEYILRHPEWQAELSLLRELALKHSQLTEEVKWGGPIYTVDGKNVLGIGAFKSYAGLWFHQGVFLTDEAGVLVNAQEGKTKALRQWRFNSIEEIDPKAVNAYIREAIQNQLVGKEMKPKRSTEVKIPVELAEPLKTDQHVASSFQKLTPFKQKEYCEYIETAKRVETKLSRIARIIPMIKEGKGLNDKYR